MSKTWRAALAAAAAWALLCGAAQQAECQTSATNGLWQERSVVDSLSGKTIVAVTLDPTKDTDNEFQQTGIIIRCKPDLTVDVELEWDQKMTSDASMDNFEIAYRIGDGDVQTESWALSSDNESLFYVGNAVAFILRLEASHAFVARVNPKGMNPISATYDTTGLRQAVAPVLKACGFAPSPS